MKPLASRLSVLTGEGALSVYLQAKELERRGRSIIHLELGEPDFHPAEPVIAALENALRDGKDRYCPMAGLPALKTELAAYLLRTREITVDPESIVVAPGCKLSLFFALMTILESGDEVLWPDPGFPGYPSITRGFDGVPVSFSLREENRLQPDPDEIARKITKRTKAIILNSPCNPTGTVYSDEVQRRIAELAVEHDLYVLSDEIYARIIYGQKYKSMFSYPGMAERTIVIDGFSKSFAMTGWRLGYTIAPPEIVPHLVMLAINSYTCTAEFTQYAAIEALRDSTGATPRMVAEFEKRRDQFIADLNCVPGFRSLPPQGAFYAWVNIEETGLTAEEVCRIMLEDAGVAGIPGAAFGEMGRNFVRFSFASSTSTLKEAVDRIQKASVAWSAVAVK
jgi:aspartate aminotransferase